MKLKDINRLRALFAMKGIHKQIDMAEAVFLSENSVVNLLKGNKVNRSTAKRIASFLDCEVTELFEEETAPKVLPSISDLVLAA